ncbi:glycosyltransferase [uncultured Marinobacter sp.]|uniref:glycosyltransferase n=1 Tax=uncultured Marinobacter sp. TaxID=187379 RepID=UPI00258E90D9|nr:glycosyltransferase [uncultured Marinobacter sp.]
MVNAVKKAIIFAPFWREAGHVGNNRIDRFVRWLEEEDYRVIIIRAGSADAIHNESWGQEITVCDRLGLYRDTEPGAPTANPRKPNKWRRALAYWLFNPDPTVVWARSAARDPTVVEATKGAHFILSSSPPESAHVGAWILSRKTLVPHIVDMRDGWLDEPLKPLLRSSALRRWLEGRLERRILQDAKGIQVTSAIWKHLLRERYPQLDSKVQVLTNGYPENTQALRAIEGDRVDNDKIVLIHAGRFTGSRLTQHPALLLEPLLKSLTNAPKTGVIRLIGALTQEELAEIAPYEPRFQAIGWEIETPGAIPRFELLAQLPGASGLLLLSASYAALPSKLFEYIPTGLPLFVVTGKGSATWGVCKQLPQATIVDIATTANDGSANESNSFYEKLGCSVPDDYSEYQLSLEFKAFIKL